MSVIETPLENERGQCPHFEHIDEKMLQQLFSKVAAIRSANYELFRFTHRPMEVFRGVTADPADTATENEIYQRFSQDGLKNFAVVIEGEVGTGKSELCAYLSHELRKEGRPILHIDKNDNLMTILSERIPEFYQEHFGEELPGADEFKNLKKDIEENPQTVANNATSGAILNLRHVDYQVKTTGEQENKIRDFIAEKLETLVNRGKYDQKVQFVTKEEYKQKEFLQIFDQEISVAEATDSLNEELWHEIRSRYRTSSLDDVLEKVGQRFSESRPVIVFEDFSIAAMEGEKLRNYMERDNVNDNWDFIIAGTRDATEVLHTQTAEDRFEFYQTNGSDSNSVLFLNEDSAVDFVRPYLGYLKAHDGSVNYERDGGSFELMPADAGSICDSCGFCDESFRDLYPFTDTFLQRIYESLPPSEQSPREYIMVVFESLYHYYKGFVDAPSSSKALRGMVNPISVADTVYDEAEVYAYLAKWYGTVDGEYVKVDRRFVDAFGFETEGLPREIEFTDSHVKIHSDDGGTVIRENQCPKCGSTERIPKDDGTVLCGQCKHQIIGPDPLTRKIEKAKKEVDAWFANPDEYPKTDMYIRAGLSDLFKELTDGYRLFEGQPLEYNLSSQRSPFVYPDENQSPDIDQVVLDREDFNRSDIRHIAEFGVRRIEKPRSADYEKILTRVGTQLTTIAIQWRDRILETQLENDDQLYKRHSGYELEDFILASYATLCLLENPTKRVTAERLNERFKEGGEFSMPPSLSKQIQEQLPDDVYKPLVKVMKSGEYIESLMGEFFGISANALDVPSVRNKLDATSPYNVLKMLGRKNISNISARLRFDTGYNVKDVADWFYDVRKALDEIVEHGYDGEVLEYVTTTIEGTDMTVVADIYNRLKTYESVNKDLQEELGKLCEYDNSDVQEVVDAVALTGALSKSVDFEYRQAALISLLLSNYPLVDQFRAVPIVQLSGEEAPSLGDRFKGVIEHYVN
ncbi:hypothetical protein [Haladaptatus sp. YSMS36]|uniref:hypothetical protein n=1 Tax=Haladaptatus sp. YSMS36 TaxID=3033384 RepID=UPI0023E7A25B|nr:hypothetical protein [Haladaptatus sp. YSMS36]